MHRRRVPAAAKGQPLKEINLSIKRFPGEVGWLAEEATADE